MRRFGLSRPLSIIFILLGTAMWSLCGQIRAGSATDSAALRNFLRVYLRGPDGVADKTTRYAAAFVNLNDSGKRQVIVYFTDRHSCGSGGCQTLILDPHGSSFKVITSLAIGWPPIRVLNATTNGWHDIALWVRGGGIRPGYEARLQFDGNTYPRNPSVPPALPLSGTVAGTVVIPASPKITPLYEP